jgi:hypothetical protein
VSIRIPPQYVNVPAAIKYSRDPRASAPVKQTYDELRGLAWVNNYKHTPALDLGELLSFLDLGRSAFYTHLKAMTELGWLRSESVGGGKLRIHFLPSPIIRTSFASPEFRTESGIPDSFPFWEAAVNTTTAEQQNQQGLEAVAVFSNAVESARYEVLSAVTEPERSRLARDLTKTPDQIKADIARWQKKGSPGVGLLVTMLRNDPPEIDPNSEEARQKYVNGEFADFIEH